MPAWTTKPPERLAAPRATDADVRGVGGNRAALRRGQAVDLDNGVEVLVRARLVGIGGHARADPSERSGLEHASPRGWPNRGTPFASVHPP